MNVIAYTRCSTQEQSEHGHSLGAQESALRESCARRGWVLVDVMADEGQSGKSLDRPALQQALKRIAAGEAEGLIVSKLDRLTRSMIDFAILLEWFTNAQATLVALDFPADLSSAGGRLAATIQIIMAQYHDDLAGVAGKHVYVELPPVPRKRRK